MKNPCLFMLVLSLFSVPLFAASQALAGGMVVETSCTCVGYGEATNNLVQAYQNAVEDCRTFSFRTCTPPPCRSDMIDVTPTQGGHSTLISCDGGEISKSWDNLGGTNSKTPSAGPCQQLGVNGFACSISCTKKRQCVG